MISLDATSFDSLDELSQLIGSKRAALDALETAAGSQEDTDKIMFSGQGLRPALSVALLRSEEVNEMRVVGSGHQEARAAAQLRGPIFDLAVGRQTKPLLHTLLR